MKKIAVVTDSTAYLPDSFVKNHNIHVVPVKIHWEDETLIDGIDISPTQFYERLDKSSTIPTTSQPSAGDFLKVFQELAKDHDAIVAPLVSSGISGTIASAQAAVKMFPDIPVEIIDTLSTSAGLALVVTSVALAVAAGKNVKEIKQLADNISSQLKLYFAVDTLKYLHKGGRIGGASRYLGAVLDIKPILYLNEQGQISAFEKVRTMKKATARLIELAETYANGKPVQVGVLHANALNEAKILQGRLLERLGCEKIEIYDVSPAIGVHAGPGTIGLAIHNVK